jgi:hypothetical protein
MTTGGSVNHLDWLPKATPSNITLLVCASDDRTDLPTESRLEDRQPLKFTLNSLADDESRELCTRYMLDYGKRLERDQLDALVSGNKNGLTTWLHVALEEIRVFGHFRYSPQQGMCHCTVPSRRRYRILHPPLTIYSVSALCVCATRTTLSARHSCTWRLTLNRGWSDSV